MHFPAMPNAPAHDPMTGGPGEPARGREMILLVEDEDAVRVIVSAVLRRSGYRVVEAATPRAAYETFERHGSDIDLLVSDVVMPEMSGPALAQRLVGLRPELRILFISGYADIATPIDEENPNVSFLRKPFQASALVARVQEMLARPNQVKPPPPEANPGNS
jgi:DNA-binding NtrC family response regulator